jgi:hypothetical protein
LGEQAKAGVVKADAVTNDTAKIGINIVGFIVVSNDWPGRLTWHCLLRPFDETARRKVQWRPLALPMNCP